LGQAATDDLLSGSLQRHPFDILAKPIAKVQQVSEMDLSSRGCDERAQLFALGLWAKMHGQ